MTAEEIISFRERVISQLETADRRMRECGACNAWYGEADELLRNVVGESNGFLFEQLIKAAGHTDSHCADLLRVGAMILGELEISGIGVACEPGEFSSTRELWAKHVANNVSLCKRLLGERGDKGTTCRHEDLVHEATLKDASFGRQSAPQVVDATYADGHVLQPRFALEQVVCI